MLKIYTDGSARANGAKDAVGAWGYVITKDNDEILAKAANSVKNTTNQRMELQAAAEACEAAAAQYDIDGFTSIQIISDSAYLINCANQKWYDKWESNGWQTSTKKDVVNRDLWERLIPFFRQANYSFAKVKGHAGDKYNEMVDTMVQELSATLK